jgi:hypothetical protein
MINRGATLISRLAVLFAVLFTFTGCGGGGGGGSSFYPDNGPNNNPNSLSLALYDPQGNATNTVTASAPGTLKVRANNNAANVVINATTTIGTLSPASGTALTNNEGVATFLIEAGAERGAGTITADATINETAVTGNFAFQVGDANLQIGYFDENNVFQPNKIKIEPESTLAAGGNAQFSVVVLDSNGQRVTTAEKVKFTSGCIAGGQANINPVESQTVNGQASTLYTATGCSGTDEITASLIGTSAQAFGTLTVAGRETNAVNFVSAEPLLIVLKGTGGQNRDETSDVVFEVVDGTGVPLPGVTVSFSLTTYVGGLTLSKTSTLTDGDGQATVTLRAGDVATVVRVLATVDDGDGNPVTTVSDLLTVTTGLPDQNSISLSVGECGGESSFVVDAGMNIDGLCRTLTVSMSDKFNNPVVDGTAAVFTTEYGSIESTCTTVGGTCSVEWRSQEPRFPTLTDDDYVVSFGHNLGARCGSRAGEAIPCAADLGEIRGGRSTVVVTAIGEESFIDRNGNGIMDEDEKDLFQNIPEAFLDSNEDGVYTPATTECQASPTGSRTCISGQEELFTDFNSDQIYDQNDDPAVYNGLLCPVEGNGVWCSRQLLNVSDDAVVTLGDSPNFHILLLDSETGQILANPDTNDYSMPANTGITILIADTYNNPPPAGAEVSVAASGACEVSASSTEALNETSSGAFVWGFAAAATPTIELGVVEITLETPTIEITWPFTCIAPAPEPEPEPGP